MIRTGRPPAAPSATVREYPPCTRADAEPQAGQESEEDMHDAEITTASPASSTRCTRSPASCGNSRASSLWPSPETSRTRTAAAAAGAGAGAGGEEEEEEEGTGVMADWAGNEAPGKAGVYADSCVLPEPRCPVTPTRQHIPDRDNPGIPPRYPRENRPSVTDSQRPQNSRKSLLFTRLLE
jgi:hypothetical protein